MRASRAHHYALILFERWYRTVLEQSAERKLRAHHELWSELTRYRERSKAAGASYADYWLLYQTVRRMKPKEILECGTGVTTIALAMALRDNERESSVHGRLTSMEDQEEYFRKAKELLPETLTPYVDIRHSAKVEDDYYLFRGVRYQEVPERPYELVYVDGPKTSVRDPVTGEKIKTFNFDLITVVQKAVHPVYALVDTRLSTCFVYQMIFKEGKVRFDYAREVGIIGPVTKDDLLSTNQMMRQLGPHPIRRGSADRLLRRS
jgi:hypothetical protein